ncbi:phage baseplate protein [Paenibacillus sp. FSL K6-1558]|uniref:phage baseplate protein n=1 Tax=Paenibacillus sp. FSL K6-1558 TaxID=2921473 RepID=UPI0030FC4004
MALIDGKYLLVEQENPTFDVDITSQPVEKDSDMTDHVQRKARTMGITGQVSGPGAGAMLTYLKKVSDKGIIVKYVGRTAFTGIISGLATGHSYKIANGYTVSFTITEVRVASSSYVDKLPTPIKAQTVKIVNSGTKQTKEKGKKGKGSSGSKKKDSKKAKKGKKGKKEKEPVQKVKFKPGSPWATT